MADISIEFDNPQCVFVPGYEVSGAVVLSFPKAINSDSVQVTIRGEARTQWAVQQVPSRGLATTSNFSGHVQYVNCTVPVSNPNGGVIAAGNHRLPFRIPLPSNCPSSFEGTYGSIRYHCSAKIARSWFKSDITTERMFSVFSHADLNANPSATLPLEITQSKEAFFLFFIKGNVILKVRLPKGGFVPGETIVLEAEIDNGSYCKINKMTVTVIQCNHFSAHSRQNTLRSPTEFNLSRDEQKEIYRWEENLDIGKGTNKLVRQVPLPQTNPTFNNCPIISVQYFLRVNVSTGAIDLSAELPIIIGTIPLRDTSVVPPPRPPPPTPTLQTGPPLYPDLTNCPPPPAYDEVCVGSEASGSEQTQAENLPEKCASYGGVAPSAPEM